jgi:hypothetical protein
MSAVGRKALAELGSIGDPVTPGLALTRYLDYFLTYQDG